MTSLASLVGDYKDFLMALGLSQARILGLFMILPIFERQLLPGLLRHGVAAGFGLLLIPVLLPGVRAADLSAAHTVMLILKETFIGFLMGYLVAIPFWVFEAAGFFIDNERGASIAQTLNPLTGNDSSPLGEAFMQTFVTLFFVSGGFMMLLDTLYSSFTVWDVLSWYPQLKVEAVPALLTEFGKIAASALLLSAPAVIAMFLSEAGLALVGRFVPQLQVFFLAMPIKSAIGFLMLVLYANTLLEVSGLQIGEMRRLLGSMGKLMGAAP